MTTKELQKKAEFYKISPNWVSLPPVPVLSTPMFGEMSAPVVCEQLKIASPKDIKQLAEAKDLTYTQGYYKGTMSVGQFKGQSVMEAKVKVQEALIKEGLAFIYREPEAQIVSRSGDECVVALCDQWYLDYSEADWTAQTHG